MNNTTDGFKVALPGVPFMADIQALYQKLSTLTDYRKPKGVRYPLALLAVFALLAKLAGQTTFEEIAEWAYASSKGIKWADCKRRWRLSVAS